MQKIKKIAENVLCWLFVAMMSFVVMAVFVEPKSVNWVKSLGTYSVWMKIIIAISAILLLLARIWLFGKTKNLKIKTRMPSWLKKGVAIMIALLVCFAIAYILTPDPHKAFDPSLIYDWVQKASRGEAMGNAAYFNRYPHNLGIVMFYLSFVKLGTYAGLPNPQIIMTVVTAISVALTVLIVAYMAGKFVKRGSALRVFVLSLICPIALYAAEMYTDSISALFVALELFVMLRIKEKCEKDNRVLLFAILATIAGIGAIIKITALIPIVAACIISLVKKKQIKFNMAQLGKKVGVVALCLGCFLTIFLGYKTIEKNVLPDSKNEALPYSHWVMMGMGGDGIFSTEDLEASLKHAPETAKYNIETIKDRLDEMGVLGYVGLLARKVSVTWGDGTYELSRVVGTVPRKPQSIAVRVIGVYGDYFKYYRFITTVLQLSWLFGLLGMAILTLKKNNSRLLVAKTSLIGIFAFLLIWETNSRYLVNFLPIIIILQEYSLYVIWKKLKEKRKATRKRSST